MAVLQKPTISRARNWAGAFVIPVGLYFFTAAILLFNLNTHPNYTYNWENNTLQGLYRFVDQPSLGPFKLLEGLMTDSISSPWTILPAWITFGLAGPSLIALRLPIALITALAVPLLYVFGRKLMETRGRKSDVRVTMTALVAALLLALSPVYMLYSRTATVVGVSLVPALLTMLALFGVLRRSDLWWRSAALLGTLIQGAYAYAPIRFLWPMCVGILLLEAFMRRKEGRRSSRRLVASALLLVVGMAGFITALDFEHEHDPIVSLGYYYSGRGEQLANLLVNVDMYNNMTGLGVPANPLQAEQLAWDLFTHNVRDMTNLFLDIDTQPALSDYWNSHGRLIPWWLFTFLLIGFLRAAWLGFRKQHYRWRIAVLFFLGFTLPMLLTSQVHIGRLIFALPFICLFAAFGLSSIYDQATRMIARFSKGIPRNTQIAPVVLSTLLVSAVAYSTWRDYTIEVPLTYEAAVTQLLRARLDRVRERGGGIALVTNSDDKLTFESINANQYRLMLRTTYHLFNLATGDVDIRRPGDTRPALYIGGLMDRLKEPQNIPDYCKNIYYVAPALEQRFNDLVNAHPELCPEPIEYKLLP
jgi:hypothetical protein